MKRSVALNFIANQLEFLNGSFEGFVNYPTDHKRMGEADVILTTLELAGMLPPCHANYGERDMSIPNSKCDHYVEECDNTWEKE